jgi:dTDP-4-amino-4,6-dideoxygalactose transaminase
MQTSTFETEFADYLGASHCIGVGNGTDALEIALRSLGLGPGARIGTVANAGHYASTAINQIGAKPIYLPFDETTLNINLDFLEELPGLNLDAVVITHLYGNPVPRLLEIVTRLKRNGVLIIEDCSQAHGASVDGRKVGTYGDVSAFSFYPTKNLGALGDAGAIVTNDPDVSSRAMQLRQYGWQSRYSITIPYGRNSRIDEIQAACLREFLLELDAENRIRREISDEYRRNINNSLINLIPKPQDYFVSHLFVLRTPVRDLLMRYLENNGVQSAIHFPSLDYCQPWIEGKEIEFLGGDQSQIQGEILSIPCHPFMKAWEIEFVWRTLNEFTVSELID